MSEPFKSPEADTTPSTDQPKQGITTGIIFGRLLISAIAWSIHGVVTFLLFAIYVNVLPVCRENYEAYELDLPVITDTVLGWSAFAVNYWYLGVAALILIDGPIAIGVCYLPRRFSWVTWIWFTSYLLFAIFVFCFTSIAMVIPFLAAHA